MITGGEAVAEAMRQIDPDVVPVYPITPQTPMIQGFARFVADGRAHGEIVNVESEHSAMSAAIGSALAGARTITATSSQGLALMAEVLYIAAAMRAPIVIGLGNRALSGPINIHCDHSDSMLVRDSGAIQLFAENAQEAYDLMLIATRVAEHPDVLLPVLVCQDGFTITHSAEPVSLLGDDDVRGFVGEYRIPNALLDLADPTSQGPFAMPDSYYELRYQQVSAMAAAGRVFDEVGAAFADVSGRRLPGDRAVRLAGADTAIVCLGSTGGTVKDVVDESARGGRRAGLLQIRSFRPLPRAAIRERCAASRPSPCSTGPIRRAACRRSSPRSRRRCAAATPVRSYVYGLGGRDLHPEESATCSSTRRTDSRARYLGLRGRPCRA